jgi:hypothetical protein
MPAFLSRQRKESQIPATARKIVGLSSIKSPNLRSYEPKNKRRKKRRRRAYFQI